MVVEESMESASDVTGSHPGVVTFTTDPVENELKPSWGQSSVSNSTSVRLTHPEKASAPISVTDDGMVKDSMLLQSQNAPSPIDSSDSGMAVEVKEVHS